MDGLIDRPIRDNKMDGLSYYRMAAERTDKL